MCTHGHFLGEMCLPGYHFLQKNFQSINRDSARSNQPKHAGVRFMRVRVEPWSGAQRLINNPGCHCA